MLALISRVTFNFNPVSRQPASALAPPPPPSTPTFVIKCIALGQVHVGRRRASKQNKQTVRVVAVVVATAAVDADDAAMYNSALIIYPPPPPACHTRAHPPAVRRLGQREIRTRRLSQCASASARARSSSLSSSFSCARARVQHTEISRCFRVCARCAGRLVWFSVVYVHQHSWDAPDEVHSFRAHTHTCIRTHTHRRTYTA